MVRLHPGKGVAIGALLWLCSSPILLSQSNDDGRPLKLWPPASANTRIDWFIGDNQGTWGRVGFQYELRGFYLRPSIGLGYRRDIKSQKEARDTQRDTNTTIDFYSIGLSGGYRLWVNPQILLSLDLLDLNMVNPRNWSTMNDAAIMDIGTGFSVYWKLSGEVNVGVSYRFATVTGLVVPVSDTRLPSKKSYGTIGMQISWSPWITFENRLSDKQKEFSKLDESMQKKEVELISIRSDTADLDKQLRDAKEELRLVAAQSRQKVLPADEVLLPHDAKGGQDPIPIEESPFDGNTVKEPDALIAMLDLIDDNYAWEIRYKDDKQGKAQGERLRKVFEGFNAKLTKKLRLAESASPIDTPFEIICLGKVTSK